MNLPKVSKEEWSELGKAFCILLILFNTIVSIQYLVFAKGAVPLLQVSSFDIGVRLPEIQARYAQVQQAKAAQEAAEKAKAPSTTIPTTSTTTTIAPEPPSPTQ